MTLTRLVCGTPKKMKCPKPSKGVVNKKSTTYHSICECGEDFLFDKEDATLERTKLIGTWVNIKCPCCGRNHSLGINATIFESEKDRLLKRYGKIYESYETPLTIHVLTGE